MTIHVTTYPSGKIIDLERIQPADIDIQDIAHHLSMQCRWNGAVKKFYSVAEHSVNVARILPQNARLRGLLHDAAEAYMGDIVTGVKRALYTVDNNYGMYRVMPVKELEKKIQSAILRRYIPNKDARLRLDSVKTADLQMLERERIELLPNTPDIDNYHWPTVAPADIELQCLSPERAKHTFLASFEALISKELSGQAA